MRRVTIQEMVFVVRTPASVAHPLSRRIACSVSRRLWEQASFILRPLGVHGAVRGWPRWCQHPGFPLIQRASIDPKGTEPRYSAADRRVISRMLVWLRGRGCGGWWCDAEVVHVSVWIPRYLDTHLAIDISNISAAGSQIWRATPRTSYMLGWPLAGHCRQAQFPVDTAGYR